MKDGKMDKFDAIAFILAAVLSGMVCFAIGVIWYSLNYAY